MFFGKNRLINRVNKNFLKFFQQNIIFDCITYVNTKNTENFSKKKGIKEMKKFTKIIPAVMLAASLATTAFAAPNAINVNNSELEGISYIVNEGKTMIPVRAICEKLGFAVEYDNNSHIVTLVKLPVTISFLPTVDGYTFARTAPLKLGTEPILVNDRTYVPVEFITEILKGEYAVDGDTINISYGEEAKEEVAQPESAKAVVTVVEIGEDSVTVMDEVRGEVVVFADEATVITDAEGKAIALKDIDASKKLSVEYGAAMTMSIPPQTTAVSISVLEEAAEVQGAETVKATASVVEIGEGFVTVMDYVRGEVVVHITEETKITDKDGKAIALADIDMSKEFEVEYAPAMTMSLPPQTTGIALVQTDSEGKDVVDGSVCEIIAEDGKVTAVVVGEKENPMTQTVLNLGEDTKVVTAEGAEAKIEDVKEGAFIRALASKMTTRSIPAQKPCYTITIQ